MPVDAVSAVHDRRGPSRAGGCHLSLLFARCRHGARGALARRPVHGAVHRLRPRPQDSDRRQH
ncbi:hypothetical protein BRD18_03215, partial [Halobacteriales archaeon SW_7_71_33]